MSEQDNPQPENRPKDDNPFIIVFIMLIAFMSIAYFLPSTDQDLLFYNPLSKTAEADEKRAAVILETHLNRPGVRKALGDKPVTARVTGNYLFVQNASIGPGGNGSYFEIYFYSGFISLMNDNQLAAIIGHELGHAILGHTDRNYRERGDSMPRFEEQYCDCYAVLLAGRVNTAEALKGIFGENNPNIEPYLNRIDKICKEDKVFEILLKAELAEQETPKK